MEFLKMFSAALPKELTLENLKIFVAPEKWLEAPDVAAILSLRRSGKFDTRDYTRRYPDVAKQGVEPIQHFVMYGLAEKRSFNCLPSIRVAQSDRYFEYQDVAVCNNDKYDQNTNISIIIPVYNGEKYIKECIDSCINQSMYGIEIIVINDGSSDMTSLILNKYANKKNVRIFNQKNLGCSVARNKGIFEAKGKYICFMDSDDYYPNADTLYKLFLAAEKNDALICGGSFCKVTPEKEVIHELGKDDFGLVFKNNGFISFSEYQFEGYYQRFIYRRDFIINNDITFPLYKRFQDPPFFVKAMTCAGKFYAIQDVVYCYRFGHQPEPIDWDREKFNDRLKGIIDVLKISKKYNLEKLHRRMVERINSPYSYDPIMNKYIKNGDSETLYILTKLNSEIDVDLLKKANYIKHDNGFFLISVLDNLLKVYSKRTLDCNQNAHIKNEKFVYYTFQDMSLFIRNVIHKIPKDIDLVVGIPRSGMIPAMMVALFLNKPCQSLTEFKNNIFPEHGNTRPMVTNKFSKILLVDDSVNTGESILKVKREIAAMDTNYTFVFFSVFVKKQSIKYVDIYSCITKHTRIFQWNYMNHSFLQNCCVDLDGVLCVDPNETENDDGELYKNFILNATPLYIPHYKIHSIVTARLSKYREETEIWLKKHNIQYGNLFMLELETAEERKRLKCHASFKADIYKKTTAFLFIESNDEQARQISNLSKKPCLCVSNDKMYY